MKIRHPALIEVLSLGVSLLIRFWMWTLRFRYVPLERPLDPRTDLDGKRYLYAFWHENMLVPAFQFRDLGIAVLISRHADGQLIARAIERLGFTTVRGSSTRGGVEAIKGMIRQSQNGHIAITPDGPKGPRRVAQQGVSFIASLSGKEVIPFGVGFARAWRLKSWDRFVLPVPFSRVVLMTGKPLAVPSGLDESDLEFWRKTIQMEMDRVQDAADRSVQGIRSGPSAPLSKAA